jgi:hypothetical protein
VSDNAELGRSNSGALSRRWSDLLFGFGFSVSFVSLAATFCTAGPPEPKSKASIELVSLTPDAGSSVGPKSIIIAQLKFSISNFKKSKDRYHISINFQSKSRASTFSKGPGGSIVLQEASGLVTITYPLERVWDDPKLRKPVVVYFYLHEQTGRRETVVLDSTDPVQFSINDQEPPRPD